MLYVLSDIIQPGRIGLRTSVSLEFCLHFSNPAGKGCKFFPKRYSRTDSIRCTKCVQDTPYRLSGQDGLRTSGGLEFCLRYASNPAGKGCKFFLI